MSGHWRRGGGRAATTQWCVNGGGRSTLCISLIANTRLDGDREVDDAEVLAKCFVGEIESSGEWPIGTGGRWDLIAVVGRTYDENCCFINVSGNVWVVCND